MGLNKGLKSYNYQEVILNDDAIIEPGETPVIDYKEYGSYIKNIAKRFYAKLPANSRWDLDDFTSEAWLALIECNNNYYKSEYNDSLKAFAYPYIVKRLSEFMAVNMYSLRSRYYNIKKNKETFKRMNWLERTMWSESQSSSDSSDEYNPILSQPSGVTSTADEVANKESQEIIQNIVNNELPKNERRAIVRRFRDGETYKEIAARLNVSTETARNFVFRGLEKIRKKAKNAGLDNCQDL